MAVHPKTLACSVTTLCKADGEQKILDLFDQLKNEIFENGRMNGALHHNIRAWHSDNSIADIDRCQCFSEGSVTKVLMPT